MLDIETAYVYKVSFKLLGSKLPPAHCAGIFFIKVVKFTTTLFDTTAQNLEEYKRMPRITGTLFSFLLYEISSFNFPRKSLDGSGKDYWPSFLRNQSNTRVNMAI